MRAPHGYSSYASVYGPIGYWSRPELIDRAYCWFRVVPRTFKHELLEMCRALARSGQSPEAFTPVGALPAAMGPFCEELLSELCLGSGIVYLTGLCAGQDRLSDEVLRWAYLVLGMQLGQPVRAPTRLLDISSRNACVRPGRTPVPSGHPETAFHTDGAPARCTPDLVGTLCLWPARTGGEYQVSSALRACEQMRRRHRPLLHELYEPFIRVGGASNTTTEHGDMDHPVFSYESRTGLRFAYRREQIEVGHRLADIPLRPEQQRALDRLDEVLNEPAGCVQFRMKRGEILFVNNHLVAHNRRDYLDDPEPARARLMVRMWLHATDAHPVAGSS